MAKETAQQTKDDAMRIISGSLDQLMADKFGERVFTVKCRDGVLSIVEEETKKQHKLIRG